MNFQFSGQLRNMRRRRKSDIIKMKILVFVLLLEYCHTEKEEKQVISASK